MSLKNDKALNASLIAFNNHIVGMKPVIKKAKVNEIQKLIRKIKLLTNKKGNEEQIEKNKKKCENLKNEIKHIKALKFNDIAMFEIDNDGTTFNDYLKLNKGLTGEKIALARIAFHKLVIDAVNKMKTDPKVDGWKRTFIQYKARAEKRKNWKEKTRQLKEIEANLKLNDEELKEFESQDKQDETNEKVEQGEKLEVKLKEDKKSTEKTKKQKKEQVKLKERKVKFSDDESSSDEEADLSEDELAEYNRPANGKTTQPVKFSDGESTMDDDNDHEDDGNFPTMELHFTDDDDDDDDDEADAVEEEDKNDSDSKSEIEYEVEKFNKPKEEVKQLKSLVIENKPAKMAIKQINLDEIKDCAEIPIDEISAVSEQELETEQNEKLEGPPVSTIPLNSDPFFLDENGREIYNSNFDDNLNQTRNSFRRFNDRSYNRRNSNNSSNYNSNYSSYRNDSNKEAFRTRRDNLNSSFKNSLSSSRPSNNNNYNRRDNNYNNNRNDFNKRDNYRDSSFKRPNNFNDKNDRNFKRANFNNNSNDSRPQFKERGSFNKGNNYTKTNDASKSEDLAKFHPSWHAKKQMEEKLKTLKFEGKKVKFDDDD